MQTVDRRVALLMNPRYANERYYPGGVVHLELLPNRDIGYCRDWYTESWPNEVRNLRLPPGG